MNVNNFQLSNVFHDNAKEYQTRPVMAAKYQPGMENGFCVYYCNEETKEHTMHEGIRFFSSETEAYEFINRNEKEYAREDGKLIEMEVVYGEPEPVLYRKDANAAELDGLHFCFGDKAFLSNESEEYEFFILDSNCDNDVWILQDMNGNIRVWDNTSDELFFGNEAEYVFEKTDKGEYVRVAV